MQFKWWIFFFLCIIEDLAFFSFRRYLVIGNSLNIQSYLLSNIFWLTVWNHSYWLTKSLNFHLRNKLLNSLNVQNHFSPKGIRLLEFNQNYVLSLLEKLSNNSNTQNNFSPSGLTTKPLEFNRNLLLTTLLVAQIPYYHYSRIVQILQIFKPIFYQSNTITNIDRPHNFSHNSNKINTFNKATVPLTFKYLINLKLSYYYLIDIWWIYLKSFVIC